MATYDICFADGDITTAETRHAARDAIRHRDIEEIQDHAVFPVEIFVDAELLERFTGWAELRALAE